MTLEKLFKPLALGAVLALTAACGNKSNIKTDDEDTLTSALTSEQFCEGNPEEANLTRVNMRCEGRRGAILYAKALIDPQEACYSTVRTIIEERADVHVATQASLKEGAPTASQDYADYEITQMNSYNVVTNYSDTIFIMSLTPEILNGTAQVVDAHNRQRVTSRYFRYDKALRRVALTDHTREGNSESTIVTHYENCLEVHEGNETFAAVGADIDQRINRAVQNSTSPGSSKRDRILEAVHAANPGTTVAGVNFQRLYNDFLVAISEFYNYFSTEEANKTFPLPTSAE